MLESFKTVNGKDLEKLLKLPDIFKRYPLCTVEVALDEYDACVAYIVRKLQNFGDDGYRNPTAYNDIADDILYENFPKPFADKLLAVIKTMKDEYVYVSKP